MKSATCATRGWPGLLVTTRAGKGELDMARAKRTGWLVLMGPGLLTAATGVGAGDLATAALVGNALGVAVLWAVVFGAGLKFVLNEGLTRWQLATGTTLLEGAGRHLGRPARWLFLLYFLPWSFMVAAALMSACGVVSHAMLPLLGDATRDKVLYGVLHSLGGLLLVWWGGYALFEKVMKLCIAVMFVTVCASAFLLMPAGDQILAGLFVPRIRDLGGQGLGWTVALIGGVGGTVTVLCYGYWIREEGRESVDDLRLCRLDLGVGYAMTAIFGLAMVIIGSTITVEGSGAGLIVTLAERLGGKLGSIGKWAFLLGAWGAVFSSLLGVWQSVPYLFADFCEIARGARAGRVDVRSRAYRLYLLALATVPMLGLAWGFARMQKAYAFVGALFMPMLCVTLLMLNSRTDLVGAEHRNRPATVLVLAGALVFFAWILIANPE